MTSRTKAISGLIALLSVGIALGAVGTMVYVQRQVREVQGLRTKEGFHEFFKDKLELRDSQHDSLRAELEVAYEQLADLRHRSAEEYNQLLDSLVVHIGPKLSAHQRVLLVDQAEKFRKNMPRDSRVMASNVTTARPAPSAVGTESSSISTETSPTNTVVDSTSASPKLKDTRKPATDTAIVSKAVPSTSIPPVQHNPDPVITANADTANVPAGTDESIFNMPRIDKRSRPVFALFRAIRGKVGLNRPQAIRVRDIIKSEAKAILIELDKTGNDPAQRLQVQLRTLSQIEASVNAILTDDQKTKFSKVMTVARGVAQQRAGN